MTMEHAPDQSLRPQSSLSARLAQAGLTVDACFQCRKCSGGCPMAFAMDLLPDQVVRLSLLGQEDQVLGSRTIWVCAACETCTTRCPNGVDIAGVMDWLKEEAARRGRGIAEEPVAAFHRFFLEGVRDAGGRLAEAKLLRRFMLHKMWRHPDFAQMKENLHLGWNLFKRRRVRLMAPPALRGKAEIKEIFKKARF